MCGEQLGIKENQETQHRPQLLMPTAMALLISTAMRPRYIDSVGVELKVKSGLKKSKYWIWQMTYCFPLNSVAYVTVFLFISITD